jgi:hypothetical protein
LQDVQPTFSRYLPASPGSNPGWGVSACMVENEVKEKKNLVLVNGQVAVHCLNSSVCYQNSSVLREIILAKSTS